MSDTTVKNSVLAPDFIDTVAPTASGESVAVRLYGSKGKSGEPSPLVLHFHGGAFVEGDLDSGCTVAGLLATAGARVVSVAYPLSPEHPFPRPLEIGYEMLQWSYKHRTRLAGKGAPMYVAGEEAGANLAAGVCLMARDQRHPPLAGQILLSPMLNPCAGTASLRAANGDATECKWAEGWSKFPGLRLWRHPSLRRASDGAAPGWTTRYAHHGGR